MDSNTEFFKSDDECLLELDPQKSVGKKCQNFRDRVLGDQDLKNDLAMYIPIRGAKWVTDSENFDLEHKTREFINSNNNKLVLMGYSGGGKSTFLRHLHRQLWLEYQDEGIISVYVLLPMIVNAEHNLMEEVFFGMGFTSKEMNFIKQNRKLCLFLDSYEESNVNNIFMENKLYEWKDLSIIITSRPHYQFLQSKNNQFFTTTSVIKKQADLLQTATILPFSYKQIEAYILKYIEEHSESKLKNAEEWLANIKPIPGLLELIATPLTLMLTMEILPYLVESFYELKEEERKKIQQVDVYDLFMKKWFDNHQKLLSMESQQPAEDEHDIKEDFWEFSCALASEMHKRNTYIINCGPRQNLLDNKTIENNSSPWGMFFSDDKPEIVRARNACPLKKVGPHHWAFVHASFINYFAAKQMLDQIDTEIEEDFESDERVDDKVSAKQLREQNNFPPTQSDTRRPNDLDNESKYTPK